MRRRDFLRRCLAAGGTLLLGYNARTLAPKERDSGWKPAYARLAEEGKLENRIEAAYEKLKDCDLCPHRCGVNRLEGEKGFCNNPEKAVVYSHQPHFGEEFPLVGGRFGGGGSGTIFFSNCNLRCVFCQNWPIAHEGRGNKIDDEELADQMLTLQRRGCHNINLVTPTHVMPHILNAVRIAYRKGLHLPLCYNTGGYELAKNIDLLDGIVDIYLPDLKFMDGEEADRYVFTGATDYPDTAQQSILTMHDQVGTLVTDEQGIALRGLMIRHLVMPNRVSGPKAFVNWVADYLPKDTYINLMDQYRVEHEAYDYDRISRAINSAEFVEAMEWAEEAGLTNLDERSRSQLQRHRRNLN